MIFDTKYIVKIYRVKNETFEIEEVWPGFRFLIWKIQKIIKIYDNRNDKFMIIIKISKFL